MNPDLILDNYYYNLPQELIAQEPLEKRDNSRLLVYYQNLNKVEHLHFYDLPQLIEKDTLIVLNNTKVIKAKLFGENISNKKIFEFLLIEKVGESEWKIMVKKSKKVKEGDIFKFNEKLIGKITNKEYNYCNIKFEHSDEVVDSLIDEIGYTPLPPYIKSNCNIERYQTVYAQDKGSIAAPTAGLHFTSELLEKLSKKGIIIQYITLHVGIGTFTPVKVKDISTHTMHKEYYYIPLETASLLEQYRKENKRIIAVGTTVFRTLETVLRKEQKFISSYGYTDLFIYPGQKILCNADLITNFHLPGSTLIMLISSLIGREKTLELYNDAINKRYRFYSFGDAMFIVR